MQKLFLASALMLPFSLAFGQLDSNSVTVTASRNTASPQADQAVFGVQVNSGLDTSLDDVLAALQGTGITIANFVGLNTAAFAIVNPGGVPMPAQVLSWTFRFAVPFAKMKDTITMLNTLQQSLPKKNAGLSLSFSVQGTQSSGQPTQACSVPDLLSDARTQAQQLASAAGLSVGTILAMTSPIGATGLGYSQILTLGSVTAAPLPAVCTLTVKFALLRF
jgi:hypothetical protein